MDAAKLAALVRLHETQSVTSSLDDSQTQSRGASDRISKAYDIVARDAEQLKAAFRDTLQTERSVGRSAYSTDVSFYALVHAVFWALKTPKGGHEGEKLRAAVFVTTLQLLHSTNASRVAQRCVPLLLEELHSLRVTDLTAAITEVLRGVQQSQRSQHKGDALGVFYTIELLPQLLLRVGSSMMLSFEASQADDVIGDLSGPQYRQRVLTKLADLVWPRRFFLQVLKNFRDFSLAQDEERTFCIKIYREARKELDSASDQVRTLEIFPTVCLSVLQLVGRTQNVLSTRLLTRLLINKCQYLTADTSEADVGASSLKPDLSERELREHQSTVLYHVDMALRQWEKLGDAFRVEYQQRSSQRLSSFDIALMLLIANHHKYGQPMLQLLLRHVVNTYVSQRQGSGGHQELVSRKTFLSVAQHAQDGNWTPIVHQMIELGFQLIEYRGLKSDHGGDAQLQATSTRQYDEGNMSEWVDFGVRLILACFQCHGTVRERVLDRVVNMVIVQNANCQTYIHVVSRIVKRHVAELSGALEVRIRECLEYVTQLGPERANHLLVALSPLLKTQHNLKEFVILVLRKAMFRKDEDSRIIGIQGFALLLCLSSRIFSRNRTLSQLYSQNVTMLSQGVGGSSSIHPATAPDSDIATQEHQHAIAAEDLYRQFSGVFRRALELQTRVRAVLYAELVKVFTECPALQEPILKLMFQHYQKFYEFNESVQPPLKLDLSVARSRQRSIIYEEPLQYLMHTMLYCYAEVKREMTGYDYEETAMDDIPATQAVGAYHVIEMMQQNFMVLFERLKQCELSDFDFDKNATFSSDSELGDTNQRVGVLVSGIVQVAINWSVSQVYAETSQSSVEMSAVWDSLLRYAQIFMWLQRKVQDPEGSQKQIQTTKKRKLTKTPLKLEAIKTSRSAAGTAWAEGKQVSASFERSANFLWATTLAPANLLRILDFAIAKARSENGTPSLSAAEEEFVLLIVEECIYALDLFQLKVDHDYRVNVKFSRQRRYASAFQGFQPDAFTRYLCEHLVKMLRTYCNEEVSLALPKGSATRKRSSGDNVPSLERMRSIVRASVRGFTRIVDMWSYRPAEEFGEQMIRALCLNASGDEESPDYEVEGDGSDGIACVLPPLRKIVDELLEHDMPDEANRLLDVVRIVWSRLPPGSSSNTTVLKDHVEWVKELLVARAGQATPRLVEKYVAMLLRPHVNGAFDCDMAQQLAEGLRHLCNSEGDDGDETFAFTNTQPTIHFRRHSQKHILTVANAILAKIDESLVETEAIVKVYDNRQRQHALKFKEDDLCALQQLEDETGSQVFRTETERGQSSRFGLFKSHCKQAFDIAGVIRPFVQMNLSHIPTSIRTVRVAGRLYKVLVVLLRDKQRRKDASLPRFLRLLFDRTAGNLSPALLRFIACIQESSNKSESMKQASATKRSKANVSAKSNKFIPDVIYQLEQFDLVMIKLSKTCRGQDFNAWCKLRASRDFRLDKGIITRTLKDMNMKKAEDGFQLPTTSTNGVDEDSMAAEPTPEMTASNVDGDSQSDDDETESAEDDKVTTSMDRCGSGKKRRAHATAEDIDEAELEEDNEDDEEVDEETEEGEDIEDADEEHLTALSGLADNEI